MIAVITIRAAVIKNDQHLLSNQIWEFPYHKALHKPPYLYTIIHNAVANLMSANPLTSLATSFTYG